MNVRNNDPWVSSCQGTIKCRLWTFNLSNIKAGRTELQNFISITDGGVTQVYCSGNLQLGLLTFAQYVATFYFLKLQIGAKFSLKHHSAGARVAAGEDPSGAGEEHCPDRNNFSGRNSCIKSWENHFTFVHVMCTAQQKYFQTCMCCVFWVQMWPAVKMPAVLPVFC